MQSSTDGPTDIESAIATAQRLLSGDDHESEIIVVTDGCMANIEQLQSIKNVTFYGVGQSRDNVGITRFQVRRSLVDAIGYQVLIDVTNDSESPKSCRVELSLDDALVDVIPMDLAPGQTETRVVDHTSADGGRLIAKLDLSDALAVDNSAVAVLPRLSPIPVVMVSEGNVFLQSVLESIPLVDLTIVPDPPASSPSGGILVLDRKIPSKMPAGHVIAVNPQSACDLWTLGDSIVEPIVATVAADSPITQHVHLDNVVFPEARRLDFTGGAEPLIQDPLDQCLWARVQRNTGDVVVLTGSLEKGDLPLRIAFPVLMQNTVEWFQGHQRELVPALPSGSMISLDVSGIGAAAGAKKTPESMPRRRRSRRTDQRMNPTTLTVLSSFKTPPINSIDRSNW